MKKNYKNIFCIVCVACSQPNTSLAEHHSFRKQPKQRRLYTRFPWRWARQQKVCIIEATKKRSIQVSAERRSTGILMNSNDSVDFLITGKLYRLLRDSIGIKLVALVVKCLFLFHEYFCLLSRPLATICNRRRRIFLS